MHTYTRTHTPRSRILICAVLLYDLTICHAMAQVCTQKIRRAPTDTHIKSMKTDDYRALVITRTRNTHTHARTCWCENSGRSRPFTLHSDPQTEDYTRDNLCVCLSAFECVGAIISLFRLRFVSTTTPPPKKPDSLNLANDWSALKVCLSEQHRAVTWLLHHYCQL